MRNPLTKEAFAEWCEKQPATELYNALSTRDCAVAQFAKALGFHLGATVDFEIDVGRGRGLPIKGLDYHDVCARPRTFGALAQRLRA